jgi:hypothetical protein
MSYSDGDQTSGPAAAMVVPSGRAYLDSNSSGVLTDDEKDVDDDGLGSFEELHGLFTAFQGEPYPVDWLDPDTDGDTLKDGADDQDHDGFTNVEEISTGTDGGLTDPLDACNPNPSSPYCATRSAPAEEPTEGTAEEPTEGTE